MEVKIFFLLDYNAIDTSNGLDMYRFLIQEMYCKTMFGVIKKNVYCFIN